MAIEQRGRSFIFHLVAIWLRFCIMMPGLLTTRGTSSKRNRIEDPAQQGTRLRLATTRPSAMARRLVSACRIPAGSSVSVSSGTSDKAGRSSLREAPSPSAGCRRRARTGNSIPADNPNPDVLRGAQVVVSRRHVRHSYGAPLRLIFVSCRSSTLNSTRKARS